MSDVIKVIDDACTRNTNKNYKSQKQQLKLAFYSYLTDEDNSYFYHPLDRKNIGNISPIIIKAEMLKNIITVYHMRKETFDNKVTYINNLPKYFNDDELEFSINNIFEKGGPQALDIYTNTFPELTEKYIDHFINNRYRPKKINKASIKSYFDANEELQLKLREIDNYYHEQEQTKNRKVA